MTLEDAMKEYLGKGVKINQLALLVRKHYQNNKIIKSRGQLPLNLSLNTVDDLDIEDTEEYIETKHGKLKVIRNDFVDSPVLVDTTTTIIVNETENTLKYYK